MLKKGKNSSYGERRWIIFPSRECQTNVDGSMSQISGKVDSGASDSSDNILVAEDFV